MKYNKFAIIWGLGLAGAFASANGPNLILDGGFENQSIGSGAPYYETFTNTEVIGGAWTVSDVSVDIVTNLGGSTYGNGVHSGNQALDLNGTPGPGMISQTFTSSAHEFDIQFWSWTDEQDNPDVKVYFDGNVVDSLTPTVGSVGGPSEYTEYNVWVSSASNVTSDTVAFDVHPGSFGNTWLDDVSVSSVPAPAAILPFALGLLRRRRARTL